jgi:WXXGXW repeat (2 copies)
LKTPIAILSMITLIGGCVHERVIVRESVANPSEEVATQEPPRVIEERVVVAPSPVHVWVGGRWAWRHGAYAWAPGYWARRPHGYSGWQSGLWIRYGHGWRWRDGYWR